MIGIRIYWLHEPLDSPAYAMKRIADWTVQVFLDRSKAHHPEPGDTMSDEYSDDPTLDEPGVAGASLGADDPNTSDKVVEISEHKHFEAGSEWSWLAPLVIVVSMVLFVGIGVALVLSHSAP